MNENLFVDARTATVTALIQSDRRSFENWAHNRNNRRKLGIPINVARFFISEPLYDSAINPNAIKIKFREPPHDGAVTFMIVEERDEALSNAESFNQYTTGMHQFLDMTSNVHGLAKGTRLPTRPEDVDPLHALYRKDIEKGIITLKDYVLNVITLCAEDLNLHVAVYDDRDELHGKGIATNFYLKIRDFAKQMGFRTVIGYNKYPDFFIKKLKRVSLDQVKPEHKARFFKNVSPELEKNYTIDFLYHKDVRQYLIGR